MLLDVSVSAIFGSFGHVFFWFTVYRLYVAKSIKRSPRAGAYDSTAAVTKSTEESKASLNNLSKRVKTRPSLDSDADEIDGVMRRGTPVDRAGVFRFVHWSFRSQSCSRAFFSESLGSKEHIEEQR